MSILRINIRDFVIIPHVELEFGSGFTALTGETGSGKSILIDAIQICMGERADSSLIRDGAERADISLTFDRNPEIEEFLKENDIELADDGTILIRRAIDKSGRSKCWINGMPASVRTLKDASPYLLDIYGQHGCQLLLTTEGARVTLDNFSNEPPPQIIPVWQKWKSNKKEFQEIQKKIFDQRDVGNQLKELIRRIELISPQEDEWQEIALRRDRKTVEKHVISTLNQCRSLLIEPPHQAITSASKVLTQLRAISELDPAVPRISEMVQQAIVLLEESGRDISHVIRKWDEEHDSSTETEQRYQQWKEIAAAVRCSPERLPDELNRLRSELAALATDQQLIDAQESLAAAEYELLSICKKLSEYRNKSANILQDSVSELLQDLGMEGAKFIVNLRPCTEPGPHGMETVEFMISTSPATQPIPVQEIASGGELSRIFLAITASTVNASPFKTLIFDEIDTGIGGAAANKVGNCLRDIGKSRQLFAVTHLAQVAAKADHHIQARKLIDENRTTAMLVQLDESDRIEEVARMLDGHSNSEISKSHAKEILKK